jgi:peptide/nickel transport system ATP-binding protein
MVRLRDFSVELGGRRVFEPFSLTIADGERVGLAGESGCGKTTTLKAIAGVLDAKVRGEVIASPEIGYTPQESVASLSPFLTVLEQVAHLGSEEKARRLLGPLGVGDERLLRSYPHQISGGQRQRILIAQALICNPSLLLCDEPVASLDRDTALQTLEIIDEYLRESGAALLVASHREDVFTKLGCRIHRMTPAAKPEPRPAASLRLDREVVVAKDVSKTYFVRDFLLRSRPAKRALDRISFSVNAGEMVAIVGPSGAGKSTLVRCLTRREKVDHGEISILGRRLPDLARKHRKMQLVPQECSESLNPALSVKEALREANPQAVFEGIPESWGSRKTCELSTGQRARVAIARALAALEEGFVVLDESLSGLDTATQNAVLRGIRAAQKEKGLACVLIAHDESIVSAAADRIVRMDHGRIVE